MSEHPIFVRNAALPEPWRSHFPTSQDTAIAFEPVVFTRALHHKVLAVARTRIEGAWAAYVSAVPGQRHEAEVDGVLIAGTKLDEAVARAIFPQFDGVPYAL